MLIFSETGLKKSICVVSSDHHPHNNFHAVDNLYIILFVYYLELYATPKGIL